MTFIPTVTIIIPAKPEQKEIKAIKASLELDYPKDKIEIIIARGKQPSAQRNLAITQSKSDLIYFLDDDSLPAKTNLKTATSYFTEPKVAVVGGPNICPPNAPWIEKVFSIVLSSWLAFGPSRARYTPVGIIRKTNEKELILCNLIARREAIIKAGGLDEALYPNEENAMLDEIQKQGGQLVYDPQMYVQRRPRPNLKTFAKMVSTYGHGRAEQFKLHPSLGSVLNFVPPLFCIYLISLLSLPFLSTTKANILTTPIFLYLIALLSQTSFLAKSNSAKNSIVATPLITLTHILYGFGFLHGLITNQHTKKQKEPPLLEIIH